MEAPHILYEVYIPEVGYVGLSGKSRNLAETMNSEKLRELFEPSGHPKLQTVASEGKVCFLGLLEGT